MPKARTVSLLILDRGRFAGSMHMELHACNLLFLQWPFDSHRCTRKEEDLRAAEEDRDGADRKEYPGLSVIMYVNVGETGSERFSQGIAEARGAVDYAQLKGRSCPQLNTDRSNTMPPSKAPLHRP